jgi:hypothetical protein
MQGAAHTRGTSTGAAAMRTLPATLLLLAMGSLPAVLLPGCASRGEALPVPQTADGAYVVPDDAVAAERTEENGDVVTEYRVAGQLRMVKVVPARGPTYYLIDRNGDGRVDTADGSAPATYFKLFSW